MGYYCYFIAAHMGEKELPQGGSIYQICTELEIVLAKPDWNEALVRARELAPGKREYVIRKIVHAEPRLERPEHFRASPDIRDLFRTFPDQDRPALPALMPDRDAFLDP